jgi:hypothetical protein
VEPGDVAGLVGLLRRLCSDLGEVEEAGARASAAFQAHYDRPAGVARICRILGAGRVEVPGEGVAAEAPGMSGD